MTRQSWLILLIFLLSACDSGKQYPTAPAPKTLHVKPAPDRRPKPMDSDDDDDDDDFDDEDDAPRAMAPTPGSVRPGGTMMATRARPAGPKTINGHPQGPRAEVFNAVVNNAMRQASTCFAAEPAGQTLSFRVQMTVGNSGSVDQAVVTAGPSKPKIRTCLVKVVKALTFPPFKGPKVTQTLPFTAIRQ